MQRQARSKLVTTQVQRHKNSRDLTWELAAVIHNNMKPSLGNLCKRLELNPNAVTIEKIRTKSGGNTSAVFECFLSHLELSIKLAPNLTAEQYSKAYDCIRVLLETLSKKKTDNEKLRIEQNICHYILKLNDFVCSIQDKLGDNITQADLAGAHSLLNLLLFLHNHCWVISSQNIVNELSISKLIIKQYVFLVHNSTRDLVSCEKYLSEAKKFALTMKDAEQQADLFQWVYLSKAIILSDAKDYIAASHYYRKAIAQFETLEDVNYSILDTFIFLSKSLVNGLQNTEMFFEAMFFLRNMKEILNTSKKNLPESYYDSLLKSLNETISDIKIKLAIKIIKEKSQELLYTYSSGDEIIIKVKNNKDNYSVELINICRQYSLDIHVDPNIVNRIIIKKADGLKIKTLEKMIGQLTAFVTNKENRVEELIEPENVSAATTSITTTTTTTTPAATLGCFAASGQCSTSMINKMKPANVKKTNNSSPKPVKQKVLEFDPAHIYRSHTPGNVFRLYPPYGEGRMYTCIAPELEAKLKIENPDALVDLKSMCERGRILGNSKGRKGFIVKGKPFISDDKVKQTQGKKKQKATTLYLKGKHCKRKWRFFGESTTKIINNKTYHLFTINAWDPKHNSKTISF